jgi:hypothetical protein
MRPLLLACALSASNPSVVAAEALPTATAVPHTTRPSDPKSPLVAGLLSATPTVIGAGLGITGLVVANRESPGSFDRGVALATTGSVLLAIGPSLGHLYNGHVWTTGLKVRLVGAGIAALGFGIALLPVDCDDIVCTHQGIGALLVGGGALTLTVGAVIDAATAPSRAREHNGGLSLARLRTSNGDSTPAVMFHTTF